MSLGTCLNCSSGGDVMTAVSATAVMETAATNATGAGTATAAAAGAAAAHATTVVLLVAADAAGWCGCFWLCSSSCCFCFLR